MFHINDTHPGLAIPEMMRLSALLRADGVKDIRDAMTVEEMAEELCRLKSSI